MADGRMAFFGRRLDAPAYEDAPRRLTPVGQRCIWCEQPIVPGDDGWIYFFAEDACHGVCHLKQLLGHGMAEEVWGELVARDDLERVTARSARK